MTRATEELRRLLDERGVECEAIEPEDGDGGGFMWPCEAADAYAVATFNSPDSEYLHLGFDRLITPEQAIAATLGSDRLALLEEKVKLQGDYIDKLTKEKNALFAQGCEAATRHAGQIDAMQRKLEAATLGSGTSSNEAANPQVRCMDSTRNAPGQSREDSHTLLPCPFCGGEADEYEGDYGNGIYCMMCGAMVGEQIHLEYGATRRVSIEEAIAAWNTRDYTNDEITLSGMYLGGLPIEDIRVFGMTLDEVRQMMKRDAERTCESESYGQYHKQVKRENDSECESCKYYETEVIPVVRIFAKYGNDALGERIHMLECTACGGAYEHVNGDYEYCPRCGRRCDGEDVRCS